MLHDETIGRVVGIERGRSEWLPALWASLTTRIEIWHLLAVCQWTLGGDIVWFELNRTDRGATMSFIPSWPESPGLDGAAAATTYAWAACASSSTPAQHLQLAESGEECPTPQNGISEATRVG